MKGTLFLNAAYIGGKYLVKTAPVRSGRQPIVGANIVNTSADLDRGDLEL